MNKIVKFYLILLIVATTIFFGYFFYKNYTPLGKFEINYNFIDQTPFFKQLHPQTRISQITCAQNLCGQTIYDDPVYFDLLVPQNFETVKIYLTTATSTPIDISLGKKIGPNWDYEIKKANFTDNIYSTEFHLSNLYKENRLTTFLISIPEIKDNDKSVKITNIKIIFEKNTLWQKIINRL